MAEGIAMSQPPADSADKQSGEGEQKGKAKVVKERKKKDKHIRALKNVAGPRWRVSCTNRSDWIKNAAAIAVVARRGKFDDKGNVTAKDPELALLYKGVADNAKASKYAAQFRSLQLWKYPACADIAISRMQAADAALATLLTDSMFWGELPRIKETVQSYLPPDDPRRLWVENFRGQVWKHRISVAERHRFESALRGAYVTHGFNRGRLRSFNKILVVSAFVFMALTVILAILGAIWPSTLTCVNVAGSRPICPLRTCDTRGDVFIIELMGVIGAAVASVASLSRSQRVEDPYKVQVAQAVLKVSLGGVTAVLGLLLLSVTPTVHPGTKWEILAYAVVFGYSQQVFTRLIDSKGDELQRAASPMTRYYSSADG
jgi:hypothetical protein